MYNSDILRCLKNDWVVGTLLIGDEGRGDTIIKITAIGESHILAKRIAQSGKFVQADEGLWTLSCRDWKEISYSRMHEMCKLQQWW